MIHAPRSRPRIGARPRFGPHGGARSGALAGVALVVVTVLSPVRAEAQVSPDTVQAPDSATVGDQELPPDSVSADTIFYNLPEIDAGPAAGFATGVWEWDRDGILASGANTLAELVAHVPGVIALWGGDYGTPAAMTAFGTGGGGYRVFVDGFERYPVEGGVADLQHIGLAGIERVRLDRSMGAMTLELWSHAYDDGRPFSVVEAGTGDLDTNVFRGVFAEPTALGGSLALGMERADTRGSAPDEGGARTGIWVRYQMHMRDRAGLAVDFRRVGSETEVADYVPSMSRSDLTVRGRLEVVPGLVAEAFTGRSSLNADDAGPSFGLLGGSRSQHGARVGLEAGRAWANGSIRLFGGDDLPARAFDVTGGFSTNRVGVSGALRGGSWAGTGTSSVSVRGRAGPLAGISAFGSWESGTFGSRDGPVLDGLEDPGPPFLPRPVQDPPGAVLADRSALRVGGAISALGATVSGAYLLVDADAWLPLGSELDRPSTPAPGSRHAGLEGWASVPLPIEGLRLEGSYQRWDEAGPFLPRQIYRASFEHHRTYLSSGNLELWVSAGVRGHDAMQVFVPAVDGQEGGLQTVPFYQNWFTRVQVRIVTVRLFFGWDNIALRRRLQTFPGRVLPFTRTFFGLRWDMWS